MATSMKTHVKNYQLIIDHAIPTQGKSSRSSYFLKKGNASPPVWSLVKSGPVWFCMQNMQTDVCKEM